MRRMGIIPGGDRLQFTLEPDQRRDPLDRQRLVAMLRAFVACHDGETARNVYRTHGALGFVLMLTAGTAGPEGFEANFLGGQRFRRPGLFRKLENTDEPVLPLMMWSERALRHPLDRADPRPREYRRGVAVDHDDRRRRTMPIGIRPLQAIDIKPERTGFGSEGCDSFSAGPHPLVKRSRIIVDPPSRILPVWRRPPGIAPS